MRVFMIHSFDPIIDESQLPLAAILRFFVILAIKAFKRLDYSMWCARTKYDGMPRGIRS